MEITTQEEAVVKQFLSEVNVSKPISWKDGVKFCMARKFDCGRALELYQNHEKTRSQENLTNIKLTDCGVKKELLSGKLTVLDSRDDNGAAIAIFTARFHNPLSVSRKTTLQSLVLQLDAAIEDVRTQRNGLIFIYDMTESKFSNFEYDLCKKILALLQGSFPARLKKVLVVLAPLWFKAPFNILRLLLREKLKDRVHTVDYLQLIRHVPPSSLPRHLGGLYNLDHIVWLEKCLKLNSIPQEDVTLLLKDAKQPYYYTSRYQQTPDVIPKQNGSSMPPVTGPPPPPRSSSRPPNGDPASQHARQPAPTVSPPPVPDREPSQQEVVHSANIKIDTMCPSWQDTDIYQSVFNATTPGLVTPEKQLEITKEHGKSGLVSEYMRIKMERHHGTFVHSRLPANINKNRYSDVLCFDFTRVVLHSADDPDQNYINANHVNSFEQKRGYICCQGPLPQTFHDFWAMIWQERVRTIVMTTRLVEKGRQKCGLYWPQSTNDAENYGIYQVMNMDNSTHDDYQVTTLLIRNTKTEEIRFIKHVLFIKWPDYGIPPSADSFLNFVQAVRNMQAEAVKDMPEWKGHPRGPPMVVHCSAGIGRSGTFITADICMYMLDNLNKVNISTVVRLIRAQRAFSIQMPDQYVFCHLAVLSYAQKRGLLDKDIDFMGIFDE